MRIRQDKSDILLTAPMSFKIDWLSFTVLPSSINNSIVKIRQILDSWGYDLSLFEEIQGRFFYNAGLTLGNYFNIFYNDSSKEVPKYAPKSVNFQLTGNGCTDLGYKLETLFDSKDNEQNWLKLFNWLVTDMGAKITRVDLALDDFEGECNFDLMIRKLKAGHYRSVKKTYSINRGADQQQRSKGLTIYVGKNVKTSKGTYYLRAYKKLAEFRAKNQLPPKKARESGVWDRYEISFTKDKAQQVVNKLLEVGSVGKVYFGVLRRLVEFLNPTKNGEGNIFKNKDNWRVCPWWDKFLKKTESVRIGSDVDRDLNFADLLAWIRRAVVPSLRLLEQIGDERGFNIYDLIQSCDVDFAKKQQRVLKDSRTIPDDLLQLYLRNFVEGE